MSNIKFAISLAPNTFFNFDDLHTKGNPIETVNGVARIIYTAEKDPMVLQNVLDITVTDERIGEYGYDTAKALVVCEKLAEMAMHFSQTNNLIVIRNGTQFSVPPLMKQKDKINNLNQNMLIEAKIHLEKEEMDFYDRRQMGMGGNISANKFSGRKKKSRKSRKIKKRRKSRKNKKRTKRH